MACKEAAVTRGGAEDVAVENRGGRFLLHPQTDRGREWLIARAKVEGLEFVAGPFAAENQQHLQKLVVALLDDGLTVGDMLRRTHTITPDGNTIH